MTMGDQALDPALLPFAGVAQELWRVKAWVFDLVVLRLASANTVAKVSMLVNEEAGSSGSSCVTLHFMRLKEHAVSTILSFEPVCIFVFSCNARLRE